jgi:hypothetical protein
LGKPLRDIVHWIKLLWLKFKPRDQSKPNKSCSMSADC